MKKNSLFQFITVFTSIIVYGELNINDSDIFEINDEFNYCQDIGYPVVVDFQSSCKHKSFHRSGTIQNYRNFLSCRKTNMWLVEKKRMQERSYYYNST